MTKNIPTEKELYEQIREWETKKAKVRIFADRARKKMWHLENQENKLYWKIDDAKATIGLMHLGKCPAYEERDSIDRYNLRSRDFHCKLKVDHYLGYNPSKKEFAKRVCGKCIWWKDPEKVKIKMFMKRVKGKGGETSGI